MDYGMLQGAIVSLKTAADLAMAFKNLHSIADVQAKAIELQQIILSAQSSALAAQSEHFSLLEQIRELKEEIARAKAWEEQRQRYVLVAPWRGAVIHALKRERSDGEPPHWICASCYESGRKSIVHDLTLAPTRGRLQAALNCPVCQAQVPSPWSGGTIPRKYAEDMGEDGNRE